MNMVYIGCVEFSYVILKHLLELDKINVAGIITRQSSSFNADFHSLQPLAKEMGIPCYISIGNDKDDMTKWISNLRPEVIYCFGWSYLLKREVLEIPRIGIVGYHPAALPKNRGRHPIIWALALGLSETASTFFFMDEGADSGDIIDQVTISISYDDDAATLYKKILETAKIQVSSFTGKLVTGEYVRIPQDHTKANYWRKRSKDDGKIDWRMSANSIYNLVRALTKPYIGAHCDYKNMEVKIWKVEVIKSFVEGNIEPGKVLNSKDGLFTIKCGEDAIRIIEHEFPEPLQAGEYL